MNPIVRQLIDQIIDHMCISCLIKQRSRQLLNEGLIFILILDHVADQVIGSLIFTIWSLVIDPELSCCHFRSYFGDPPRHKSHWSITCSLLAGLIVSIDDTKSICSIPVYLGPRTHRDRYCEDGGLRHMDGRVKADSSPGPIRTGSGVLRETPAPLSSRRSGRFSCRLPPLFF